MILITRFDRNRRTASGSGRSGLALFVRSDPGYYTFMVPEHVPFRARFEEYILERTANHLSLVPMIMHGQGKARFRLACKETLDGTDCSSWLDQAALDGPDRVLIDEEISACLKELGYPGELSYRTVPGPADSTSPEDEATPHGFEELIQIVRSAAAATPLEFMRLVLASSPG